MFLKTDHIPGATVWYVLFSLYFIYNNMVFILTRLLEKVPKKTQEKKYVYLGNTDICESCKLPKIDLHLQQYLQLTLTAQLYSWQCLQQPSCALLLQAP